MSFLQDSGAYFLHLLWNVYRTSGYARSQVGRTSFKCTLSHSIAFSSFHYLCPQTDQVLAEAAVYEAASLLVDVWTIEQHHEQRSPYRYSELPRNGLGPPSNYTGEPSHQGALACQWRAAVDSPSAPPPSACMSWSGFRPSDDQQMFGFNVPANMRVDGFASVAPAVCNRLL